MTSSLLLRIELRTFILDDGSARALPPPQLPKLPPLPPVAPRLVLLLARFVAAPQPLTPPPTVTAAVLLLLLLLSRLKPLGFEALRHDRARTHAHARARASLTV